MLKQRTNYWSCSKFADWLRGTAKPGAATSEGWRAWRKTARNKSGFRYWLAEEGLDTVQNILYYPSDVLNSIRYYWANRWMFRTNSLTAHPENIKPGQWCDVGNRFLPCLFNELVDFVEVETAAHRVAWNGEDRDKYPKFSRLKFYFNKWRCPEAGLDHLQWAAELTNSDYVDENDPEYGKPTHQALAAREILALYDWWKNVYPTRPSPMDVSGWSELCNKRRERIRAEEDLDDDEAVFDVNDRSPEEKGATRLALDKMREIEEQYEAEDTEMLIRLIKVRNSLWT